MAIKKMYKKAGLKGGQHKLDKNKDGKLSGADFKMMKHGGVKKTKKQMGGVQSPRPAASFIEPPTAQPFEQDSFVAQSGGERMKALRKEQREVRKTARKARRADRKADREAVRTLKRTSRAKRRDKISDAGKDISLSRSERREDRRAVNKASRVFKRQERKGTQLYFDSM